MAKRLLPDCADVKADRYLCFLYMSSLRRTDTLSRETTISKLFLLLSEKVSSLKGKNLLPFSTYSFLLE